MTQTTKDKTMTTSPEAELHRAAAKGNMARITTSLEAGADIEARNKYGLTALHVVAEG
ncbi:MAG: ankyrin repeat domain-containing protein, partial [Alphaproteobacteria bacterium]|nr:ankyrin repeat domain-containing protein [Alphaproteobacteria bacterium]